MTHQWENRYNKLRKLGIFGQDAVEFSLFLRFAAQFFLLRGNISPLVVEIGVRRNRTKAFYEDILSATYISIDVSDRYSKPDIIGDSHDFRTFKKLERKLKHRNVDLLFIDGDHSFDGIREDFFIYSQLVKQGLVAVHDIACQRDGVDVPLFWSNLIKTDQRYPYVTFFNHRAKDLMGIGLQVRER